MLDDDVVGPLVRLVWNAKVGSYRDLVVVVLRLLSQAVQVLVEGVDVVPVGDAVEGAVVEVRHLGVVSVDAVVEDVVDAQLQLILLEEGQDLLYGQSLLDVLLRPTQDL